MNARRVLFVTMLVSVTLASCAEILGITSATVRDASVDGPEDTTLGDAGRALVQCGDAQCLSCCAPEEMCTATCPFMDGSILRCDDLESCPAGQFCCFSRLSFSGGGGHADCVDAGLLCDGEVMCDPAEDACPSSAPTCGPGSGDLVNYHVCQ